jgi:hypothetical protein
VREKQQNSIRHIFTKVLVDRVCEKTPCTETGARLALRQESLLAQSGIEQMREPDT